MRIALRVVGNFIEDGRQITLWTPVKLGSDLSIIHHQPRNIERTRGQIGFERMFSETLGAPACKLRQRHGVSGAPSDVERHGFRFLRVFYLLCDKLGQIVGMKPVPNLPARAIKPDVFQRALLRVGMYPVRENPLLCGSKLPCSRDNATAIDPYWERETMFVFQSQELRRQLGAAIE